MERPLGPRHPHLTYPVYRPMKLADLIAGPRQPLKDITILRQV